MTLVSCVPRGREKAGSCSEFCASARIRSYSVRGPDDRLSASLGDRQEPFQGAVVALSPPLPTSAPNECIPEHQTGQQPFPPHLDDDSFHSSVDSVGAGTNLHFQQISEKCMRNIP